MSGESVSGNFYESKATRESPHIRLDKASGLMELTGTSMPENPMAVYGPVMEWLRQYAAEPAQLTRLVFRFSYYNTSTSKILLLLLEILEGVQRAGKEVVVEWHYQEDDEDMEEAGQEFASSTSLTVKMVTTARN